MRLWWDILKQMQQLLGSLSIDVFEQRTQTGSRPWAFLGSGFAQIFRLFVSIKEKILSNTNMVASRYIERERPHFRLTSVAQKLLCFSSLVKKLYHAI